MNVNKEHLKKFMVYCEKIDSTWAREFASWIDDFIQEEDRCKGIEGGGCKNDGQDPHFCPLAYELHGLETLCNCCDDCTTHCLHEI